MGVGDVNLSAKIAPLNDGFVGMVDADQVLGGGGSGTLPDACLDAKYRTRGMSFYLEVPTNTDEFPHGTFPVAGTIIKVIHQATAGTVTWNIEIRDEPDGTGAKTDIFTSEVTSSSTKASETTGFSDATVPAESWLYVDVSAVSSGTKLWIQIIYTID